MFLSWKRRGGERRRMRRMRRRRVMMIATVVCHYRGRLYSMSLYYGHVYVTCSESDNSFDSEDS